MNDKNEFYEKCRKEVLKFKSPSCPVWVLTGQGCAECPLREKCPNHNPGAILGIDHEGLYRTKTEKVYLFAPYSLSEEQRAVLKEYCASFKLDLKETSREYYSPETLTIEISATSETKMFRKCSTSLGRPCYGSLRGLKRNH